MSESAHLPVDSCQTAVVIGASQGIGLAFVKNLLTTNPNLTVFATYRRERTAHELRAVKDDFGERLNLLQLDAIHESQYQDLAIAVANHSESLDLAINCIGFLHDGTRMPEKRLSEISEDMLVDSFRINSMPVVFLAKHLYPLFKNPSPSLFASLSARVGSIADNRSGGWYSYRSSKAAHNMLLKNIALEYERFRCHTVCLALHPGTTDTALSKPFTSRTRYTLHSPDATAANLIQVMATRTTSDNGGFFDWQGQSIPW